MTTRITSLETNVWWIKAIGSTVIIGGVVALIGILGWTSGQFGEVRSSIAELQKGQADQVATMKGVADNVAYIRGRLDNHSDAQSAPSSAGK